MKARASKPGSSQRGNGETLGTLGIVWLCLRRTLWTALLTSGSGILAWKTSGDHVAVKPSARATASQESAGVHDRCMPVFAIRTLDVQHYSEANMA